MQQRDIKGVLTGRREVDLGEEKVGEDAAEGVVFCLCTISVW